MSNTNSGPSAVRCLLHVLLAVHQAPSSVKPLATTSHVYIMCWTSLCTYLAIPKAARVAFLYFTRKQPKTFYFCICIESVGRIRFGEVDSRLMFADTRRTSYTCF